MGVFGNILTNINVMISFCVFFLGAFALKYLFIPHKFSRNDIYILSAAASWGLCAVREFFIDPSMNIRVDLFFIYSCLFLISWIGVIKIFGLDQ